ncbi:MAG: hypothetical protein KatS3mg113_0420 [Planctomycetaceae bacterium]|nr:MAG: hypothetical protein KatS3mg113_0420 [Planctomycetaceae bacterium]
MSRFIGLGSRNRRPATWLIGALTYLCQTPLWAETPDPRVVAAEVDRLIDHELQQAGVQPAPLAADDDFLRRVYLDLIGHLPSPRDVTLFGLDPDSQKRDRVTTQLLRDPRHAEHWALYWRDVIFSHATSLRGRIAEGSFTAWMTEQLAENRRWDEIVRALITATGNVQEQGQTALFAAHDAQPAEVAAEVSRIFLGIQIQCANCHDHPSDVWKREQFHQLAAFFPRVSLRPILVDGQQRGFELVSLNVPSGRTRFLQAMENAFDVDRILSIYDRNRDGRLSGDEVQRAPGPLGQLFRQWIQGYDEDKDGQLNRRELEKIPPPPMLAGRGSPEYYMPDLNDPRSRGRIIEPQFFVDGTHLPVGSTDEQRRETLARTLTSPQNPWFARALVNRIWHELLGEGFYMPVDDLGPMRQPRMSEALETLCSGFIQSGYDLRWLYQTIVSTRAYQRQIRTATVSEQPVPFAAQLPVRLRAHALYNALLQVLGISEPNGPRLARTPAVRFRNLNSPRTQFINTFNYDPSTPHAEVTLTIPQSLLMMNGTNLQTAMRGTGGTMLAQLLNRFPEDTAMIHELFLLVYSREPTPQEAQVCLDYIRTTNMRTEAFEDLLWSLINSSEFLSRR